VVFVLAAAMSDMLPGAEPPLTAVQSRQNRSRQKQPTSVQNLSREKRMALAKQYVNRGNKKLKARDYAGALKDFQRAQKLYPNKKTKSYVSKLTAMLKKRSQSQRRSRGAATGKEAGRSPRRGVSRPLPPAAEPVDMAKISRSFSQMSARLDGLRREMERAQKALRPFEKLSASTPGRDRLVEAERKVTEKPEDWRAQRSLALEYENKGMVAKAKDIYLRMIASNPSNPDFHYFLGSLYAKMGQPRKAKFAFQEALEIDPNHLATLNALSIFSQEDMGREMASDLMKKAAQEQPGGAARLLQETREKLESGSYEDVITLTSEGKSQYPDNPVFPFLAGQAYREMGDLEEAKKRFKEGMALEETVPSSSVALADLYFDEGNYLYAAITYESSLAKDPRDVGLRFKQGLSYFKAYEWAKAASAWEDLLRYAPNHPEVRLRLPQVYYILSLEYSRNGFTDLSRRTFSNAISVNPRSGEWLGGALETAGHYYQEHGLYGEALKAYQDAIELRPGDPDIYNGLGVTYWFMGEKEMAVAAWEKSLSIQPEDNSAQGWLLLARRRSGS
ncbi:MAG: tetratricopeptide repeat protein, partial [Fidelibacterota bacterium]